MTSKKLSNHLIKWLKPRSKPEKFPTCYLQKHTLFKKGVSDPHRPHLLVLNNCNRFVVNEVSSLDDSKTTLSVPPNQHPLSQFHPAVLSIHNSSLRSTTAPPSPTIPVSLENENEPSDPNEGVDQQAIASPNGSGSSITSHRSGRERKVSLDSAQVHGLASPPPTSLSLGTAIRHIEQDEGVYMGTLSSPTSVSLQRNDSMTGWNSSKPLEDDERIDSNKSSDQPEGSSGDILENSRLSGLDKPLVRKSNAVEPISNKRRKITDGEDGISPSSQDDLGQEVAAEASLIDTPMSSEPFAAQQSSMEDPSPLDDIEVETPQSLIKPRPASKPSIKKPPTQSRQLPFAGVGDLSMLGLSRAEVRLLRATYNEKGELIEDPKPDELSGEAGHEIIETGTKVEEKKGKGKGIKGKGKIKAVPLSVWEETSRESSYFDSDIVPPAKKKGKKVEIVVSFL